MAINKHYRNNNPYSGTADIKLSIPLNDDHYMMQISYSGFNPGAGTGFKLHRVVSTNPQESELVEIADSEQIIDDASGIVVYSNELPEKADFLVLEYTADGNSGTPEFNVNMSVRS